MDGSFILQLVSSHLLSNIILKREKDSKSIQEEVQRLFGLCQNNDSFQEKRFYQTCWSGILDVAENNNDDKYISSFAYSALEGFAYRLSQRSNDYGFYCERLLQSLHSAILSGQIMHLQLLKCLISYLECANRDIICDLFDRINKVCTLISQTSESPEHCLGAIHLWRCILIRGASSKSCHLKHTNLTLILSQIQILAASRDLSVQESGHALLQDLIQLYKSSMEDSSCSVTSNRENLLVSQDILNLDVEDDFQEQEEEELEYFLRGSIVQKYSTGTMKGLEELKKLLLDTCQSFSDKFSSQEMFNIKMAIREGVNSSVESDLSVLECIFGKFLEITYGQLTAMAQKSISIDSFQLQNESLSLKNASSISKSIQELIDTYKHCVMHEADDVESKFVSYVAPHFKRILS